jgi:hypothetical protein
MYFCSDGTVCEGNKERERKYIKAPKFVYLTCYLGLQGSYAGSEAHINSRTSVISCLQFPRTIIQDVGFEVLFTNTGGAHWATA